MVSFKRTAIVVLTPVVFACELLLPEQATLHVGVGEALGCSGGSSIPAPSPGFTMLRPRLAEDPNVALPVATDGFFAIDAGGYQLSEEAAKSGLQVVVKDGNGVTVSGETKLLSSGGEGSAQYVFGWSASSPLALDAQLDATLSATPVAAGAESTVGGHFKLEVVGEPMPLPETSLRLSFLSYYHGAAGATLSCETSAGSCSGPTALGIPVTLEKQLAVDVRWQLPQVKGGVAWSARLEAPQPSDANVEGLRSAEFLGLAAQDSTLDLGRIVFPTAGSQYCTTLVVTDLRTQQERRAQTCVSDPLPQGAATDTQLGACTSPPSQTLTEAWCQVSYGASSTALCGGGGAGAGGSGSAGVGVGGSGGFGVGGLDYVMGNGGFIGAPYKPGGTRGDSTPASGAAAASNGSSSAAASGSSGPHTSQGCLLGGAPAPRAGAAWWLSLLGLIAAGRARSAWRRKSERPAQP